MKDCKAMSEGNIPESLLSVINSSDRKWVCEVVRDFDGTYYANLWINGTEIVGVLPEYVDYNTLRRSIKNIAQIEIPFCKDMIFERYGRKFYALLDATRKRDDLRVTFKEHQNGWTPCWN